jgi:hypothetical protein
MKMYWAGIRSRSSSRSHVSHILLKGNGITGPMRREVARLLAAA